MHTLSALIERDCKRVACEQTTCCTLFNDRQCVGSVCVLGRMADPDDIRRSVQMSACKVGYLIGRSSRTDSLPTIVRLPT